MIYYDIHSHHSATHPGDIAIISVDLCDPHNSLETSINNHLSGKQISESSERTNHYEYYSVGIHPWHADKNFMTKVHAYATLPFVVAIGETGLDKITADTQDKFRLQQELFTEHIYLSEKVRKPLIIHCVKAWDELLHIRKATKPSMPWIIHGFRGKETLALQLLNTGLYLSFGMFHDRGALKASWEKQRLLAETDDKDTDIRNIYKQIAEELDITIDELSGEIGLLFKTKFFVE